MCDEANNGAAETATPPPPPQADSLAAQEMAWFRRELEVIRQEIIELRMGRRKVLLEELAMQENPLIEQGVIAQRTRPPRRRGESPR